MNEDREECLTGECKLKYIEGLYSTIRKNYQGYEKKLIVDATRRKYAELWLHRRQIKERVASPGPSEGKTKESAKKEAFLIMPHCHSPIEGSPRQETPASALASESSTASSSPFSSSSLSGSEQEEKASAE